MTLRRLVLAFVVLLVPVAASAQQVSAPGALYKSAGEGWQIQPGKAWKHTLNQGRVVIASDTEPGLLLAWFQPGATYPQVQQYAKENYQEEGLTLVPGAAAPFGAKAGKALAVNYSGVGQDGSQIRSRAIAVVGAKGAVYVVGLTTEQQFAGMSKRVDELAKTVVFFTPKTGAGVALISGSLCGVSGGDNYSASQRMNFNGKGQVSWGSEMVFGGDIKDGSGDTTGSFGGWSGNQNQPSDQGTYTVAGDSVNIRWGDGSTLACVAHHKVNGKITELKCGNNGKLYGRGLCD